MTPLSRALYELNRTRGIYGLRCPVTGMVRYIGSSEHIERRYWDHCERLAGPQGGGWAKRNWMLTLRQRGLRPELVILQKVANSDMQEAEAQFIAAYELVGGADLNINLTSKRAARNKSRIRNG